MFFLIVDNFGIKYVGDSHLNHLHTVLTDHYTITEDLGIFFLSDIELHWNYAKDHAQLTCCLSMDGYIDNLLLKFEHKSPTKPKISPHRHRDIVYGSKQQLAADEDTSPKLTEAGIKSLKAIIGALLYCTRTVDNKLHVGLSAIGAQQDAATEQTAAAINQLLDRVVTYPNDGITYWASDMVLAAHSDSGFKNESNDQSRAGAYIFLSEDMPTTKWNGAVLTIAHIIKFLMSSAAEAQLCALYITAKEMIPARQTLIGMGRQQPPFPVQTENLTAEGVINTTIIQRKSKSMELRFHWLRCRELQGQLLLLLVPCPPQLGGP